MLHEQVMKRQLISNELNAIAATALLVFTIAIANQPLSCLAAGGGGTGGGGTSGGGTGGGGGGGGGVVSSTITGVLAYSNIGTLAPSPNFGWSIMGLQPVSSFTNGVGFYTYVADRFTPGISGSLSTIRVPVQQYATGGNGQFSVRIFSDDPVAPGTVGALIGSFQGGQSSPAISNVNISNGPRLVAGQAYWIEVVPSPQSREFWETSPEGIEGIQLYIDAYSGTYYPAMVQGAFEIYLIP
jgi:hypothetical protein